MTNNYIFLEYLLKWNENQLLEPITNQTIEIHGPMYKLFDNEYKKNINLIDIDFNKTTNALFKLNKLIMCDNNCDPYSLNIFWKIINDEKIIVYPFEQINKLIFYVDANDKQKCLELETLIHFQKNNIVNYPSTTDVIPNELFTKLLKITSIIDLNLNKKLKITKNTQIMNTQPGDSTSDLKNTIVSKAINVFQMLSEKSIVIDHNLFVELTKTKILIFNIELQDYWVKNLTVQQRALVSENVLFNKTNTTLTNDNIEYIQVYLLDDIKIALECDKTELVGLITTIIFVALEKVIPIIK